MDVSFSKAMNVLLAHTGLNVHIVLSKQIVNKPRLQTRPDDTYTLTISRAKPYLYTGETGRKCVNTYDYTLHVREKISMLY